MGIGWYSLEERTYLLDVLKDIDNIGQTAIAGLNPADIDNITVLKDAAATAIYGARAANGVIRYYEER